MKKWLLAALLAIVFSPAALAQGNGRDRDHRGEGPRAAPPAMAGPRGGGNDNRPPASFSRGAPGPRPGATMAGPRPLDRAPRPGFAPRPGSRPDIRRDFGSLHRTFTSPRRFRIPAYRRPPGFYVHRWSFGEFLPAPFWVRDYWLDDYFDFGLMPPPPGTVWVRYGNDALLIDEYGGEVIQVAYNVFY